MQRTSSNFSISCFRYRVFVWIMIIVFFSSFMPSVSLAQQPTATINTLNGIVLVNGQDAEKGMLLSAGNVIETQSGARVVLELSDGSLLELGENTKLDLALLSQTATGARVSRVKLLWGRIRALLSPGHQAEGSTFDIETPNALVGVQFSQPDVEVSYDPAKAETVALALTVALSVKNFVTDEEKIVPIGSMAIITALGIKVVAGAIATGNIVAEKPEAGATDTSVTDAATAAGASETEATTGAATTGATTAGISTKTILAIGVGAAAAVGGLAVIVSGSGDGDGGNSAGSSSGANDSFTGRFIAQFVRNNLSWTRTLQLSQNGRSISGSSYSEIKETGYIYTYAISGIVNGLSADLRFYDGQVYRPGYGWETQSDYSIPATLINDGSVLQLTSSDGTQTDYYRQ